jgi:hypothetical protein
LVRKRLILKLRFGGKDYSLDVPSALVGYVRENWGAPFIVVFMALLIACAGLLASGLSSLANDVAVYAYYFLVVGVVLQLVAFIRDERGKGQNEVKPDSRDG